MDSPVISVIIPVYGVEKYIERCARSLFEQTMTERIEFIFIDDCTPDKSISVLEAILSEYPLRIPQTKIIHHQENKGSALTRRTGISAATGLYIAFTDSDDWVEPEMYEQIAQKVLSEDLDMIICNNDCVDFTGKRKFDCSNNAFHSFNSQNILELLLSHKIRYTVWSKVAKRIFYQESFIYPVSSQGEDLVFSVQVCHQSCSIGYIQDPLYHYFDNPTSLVNHPSEEHCFRRAYQFRDNIDLTIEYLKKQGIYEIYKNKLPNIMLECRLHLYPILGKHSDLWRSLYPELDSWQSFKALPFKSKIKYLLGSLHLSGVYLMLRKICQ